MSSITAKLSDSSRAAALLQKMFQDEEIGPGNRPKTVRERNYIFERHKLDYFWAKYNKLRLEKKNARMVSLFDQVFLFSFHLLNQFLTVDYFNISASTAALKITSRCSAYDKALFKKQKLLISKIRDGG